MLPKKVQREGINMSKLADCRAAEKHQEPNKMRKKRKHQRGIQ